MSASRGLSSLLYTDVGALSLNANRGDSFPAASHVERRQLISMLPSARCPMDLSKGA